MDDGAEELALKTSPPSDHIMKTFAPSLRRNLTLQILVLATLLPGISIMQVPLQANPAGANVVAGGVSFDGLGTSNLNINQSSGSAIINWQSFSIQNGEVTTFNQPGVNSVALNRVMGGNPSAIYGALRANGGVVVVNPNGIVVHAGGVVDVAGMLTMSTLDIDNDDFLNGGDDRYYGNSSAGVTNYGAISSANSDVVLLGNFLHNAGSVSAPDGTVAFGAGGDILVQQGISGASISVQGAGAGAAVGIENSGSVTGAAVDFAAHGNTYALAIQNEGVIRATGVETRGGRVMLRAGGSSSIMNTGQIRANNYDGSGGDISIEGGNVLLESGSLETAGTNGTAGGSVKVVGNHVFASENVSIDASGSNGGSVSVVGKTSVRINADVNASGAVGNGGAVDVTGNSVTIGSASEINVSGSAAGGRARLGGGFQGGEADIANANNTTIEAGSLIIADSAEGNAGQVVIWADGDTTFNGEISAQAYGAVGNGGLVEVSGLQHLGFDGLVSTLAVGGQAGTLLLDPTNVSIGAGGDITAAALLTALGLGNVIIHTNSAGTDTGNIMVLPGADLTYDSAFSFGMFANGSIVVDDDIQNAGTGAITLFAGWDGTGVGDFSFDPTMPGVLPDAITETAAIDAATVLGGAYGAWGQNGGNIKLNDSAVDAVSVGSAHGETNLFGGAISVQGGNGNDRPGQVGYRTATVNPDGDINVYAKFFINIDSGGGSTNANGRVDSHAMIGHGGSNHNGMSAPLRSGDGNLSGDITVISDGGGIIMKGSGSRSFSKIGHGGHSTDGVLGGDITVEATYLDMMGTPIIPANRNNTFVQVGHGGINSVGAKSGDISVVVDQYINGFSGVDNQTNTNENFAMIGHGGSSSGVTAQGAGPDRDAGSVNGLAVDEAMAGHVGAIYVEAKAGDISFRTGAMNRAFNQIGHGGYQSHGNHRLTMLSDGSQTTGALKAGITVIAGGDINFSRSVRTNGTEAQARAQDRSYSQIGLGGWRAGGRFEGDIDIVAGGDFFMQAGSGNDAYAQVGHGGVSNAGGSSGYSAPDLLDPPVLEVRNGHATLSGDISLVAGGDIGMFSGAQEDRAYSMVGHGGNRRIADFMLGGVEVADIDKGHHGDILVDAGGSVTFQASPFDTAKYTDIQGNQSFTLLGHGGVESQGDHHGDITLNAGALITFAAGRAGWEEYNPGNDNYNVSQTGAFNFAMLGHGGYLSGLQNAQDTQANGQNRAYLFNGNTDGAGVGALGSSDITVTSTGGGLDVLAVQEQGGMRDDHDDQLDSDGMTPRPVLERNVGNFAKVGHGGYNQTNANRTLADVSVTTGDIMIDVAGPVNVVGDALDQLDIIDEAATVGQEEYNNGNFAQIGHGGAFWESGYDGSLFLNATGDVNLTGGFGLREYAKIGHGGFQSAVNVNGFANTQIDGDLTVYSGGSINLQGNSSQNEDADYNQIQHNWVQIGHGAMQRDQTIDSDITVAATVDISLKSGAGLRDAYTHIGHGGFLQTDANITGVVDVTAGRDVLLENTDFNNFVINISTNNYSKIGHGDTTSARNNSTGTWNGDIYVKAGRDVHSIGGMIGHADPDNGANLFKSDSGNTYIAAGRTTASPGAGSLIFEGRLHDKVDPMGPDVFTHTRISNAFLGQAGPELRLYTPSVAENQIDDGTRINGTDYDGTNPDVKGGASRTDEQIGTEFTLGTGAYGQPTGTFTPEGPFPATSNAYQVYYPDAPVVAPPGGGGGGGSGGGGSVPPPFVTRLLALAANNLYNTQAADEVETRRRAIYDSEGNLVMYVIGIALDDAILSETEEGVLYYSFMEDALDSVFGPRRHGRLSEDNTILALEDDEELLRRYRKAQRPVGTVGVMYYLYAPGTSQYSSLRVFGSPLTDVPAFGPQL